MTSVTWPPATQGAAGLGIAGFALAHDFVIALAVGAGFYAVTLRLVKAREHAHR
jgi:hypothetical protein